MADKLHKAIWRLTVMQNGAKRVIEKHISDLNENPAYAMSWSRGAFTAAAEVEFAGQWLYFLGQKHEDRDAAFETLAVGVSKTVADKARYINNHSSSATSNLMDQCQLAVAAKFLEDLNWTRLS